MATITVNTFTDEQDGSILDGDISLRDAIAAAGAGDVIEFSSIFGSDLDPTDNFQISLTLGTLEISQDITINGDVNGDGIADVTLNGASNNFDGIFALTAGADVDFHALTFLDGSAYYGGAIDMASGSTARVTNSLFLSNYAYYSGGAIDAEGSLILVNSFLSENTARGGGAIRVTAEGNLPVSIINSTLTQNSAFLGGAIISNGSLGLEIINSTITGNNAGTTGGGIDSSGGVTIRNSLVIGNNASGGVGSEDDIDSSSLTSNGNNIFGNGVTGTATGDQTFSAASFPTIFADAGPITIASNTFDAGRVTRDIGVTPVIEIVSGGPAANAGDNADVPSEMDLGFDVDRDGTIETGPLELDANGLNRIVDTTVDIGAAESFGRTWIVDTTDDEDDNDLTTGNLSIREAFKFAQDGDTISFDPTVFTADTDERSNTVIDFDGDRLPPIASYASITLNGDVNGDGIADVTVDLSGAPGQFLVVAGTSAIAIESMTFMNASNGYNGSVIRSDGEMSILNSSFIDNTSDAFGGALFLRGGSTTNIVNSTFEGNEAESGGAILSNGVMTILNSTFTGNAAVSTTVGQGGGAIELYNNSTVSVINSTITGNTAVTEGGGFNVYTGTLNLYNSIVLGNAIAPSGTSIIDDVYVSGGAANSDGTNVFGNSAAVAAGDAVTNPQDVFETTTTTTVNGISVTGGTLASNGGPTDTVLILSGGLAVGRGDDLNIPTETSLGIDVNRDGMISGTVAIDQQGNDRVIGDSVDAGAVEVNTDLVIVTTTEDTRDGDTSLDDISWREAISIVSDDGIITFDPNLFLVDTNPLNNVAITVSNGDEVLDTKALHFDGDLNDDGIPDVTFEQTNASGRWITINSGANSLVIDGLNVDGFFDSGRGGAIYSGAPTTILNSNFTDSYSGRAGGALYLSGAGNTVSNTYFGGNSSYFSGGAFYFTGNSTLVGNTFFNNFSQASGGAIGGNDGLSIINSTLTGNGASQTGGGVNLYGQNASLFVANSIVAGNIALVNNNDIGSPFASNSANIFGSGIPSAGTNDIVLGSGVDLEDIFDETTVLTLTGNVNVEAGAASFNWGTGPTVSLNATNPANPAIDRGNPVVLDESLFGFDLTGDGDLNDIVSTDGRGFARSIDIPIIGTFSPDIGAFEIQLTGTFGADILLGTNMDDGLEGFGGGDSIDGGIGSDTLLAGAGDDRVNGGDNNDRIDGASGDDSLFGGAGDDTINGGNEDDQISGGTGENVLRGQGGADTVSGASDRDEIAGGTGDDSLSGGGNNDTILGQNNADMISGGAGDDILRGGSGNDTVDGDGNNDNIQGQGNNDLLRGGAGDDTLSGAAGLDTLEGGSGDDRLLGGGARDRLDGGSGNDTLSGGTTDASRDDFVFAVGYDQDRINSFDQAGTDKLLLDEDLWLDTNPGGLTAQQVIDTFGSLGTNGTILTLDFGGGDILEVQNGAGITQATLGADVIFI